MPVKESVMKKVQKKTGLRPAIDEGDLETIRPAGEGARTAAKRTPEKLARMTAYERRKREKDKERNRETFDCRPEVSDAITMIYNKYRKEGENQLPFPRSDLIEYLVVLGMRRFLEVGGGVRRMFEMTRSPRYDGALRPSEIPDVSEFDASQDQPY
jgi:hypothetical protein